MNSIKKNKNKQQQQPHNHITIVVPLLNYYSIFSPTHTIPLLFVRAFPFSYVQNKNKPTNASNMPKQKYISLFHNLYSDEQETNKQTSKQTSKLQRCIKLSFSSTPFFK